MAATAPVDGTANRSGDALCGGGNTKHGTMPADGVAASTGAEAGQSAFAQLVEAGVPASLCAALCRQPVALAFSGGLDSRFLAFIARRAGADVLLVHAAGPHVPPQEKEHALRWAAEQHLPLLLVEFNPLALDGVRNNSRERCYACKRALFACMAEALAARGQAERRLCDGTHAGDLLVWRPGLRALQEAGVWSPLAEAGLDKAALRRLARACGMDEPEQRARPCLLTRLAYGLRPDAAMLARVAAAEAAVATALTAATATPVSALTKAAMDAPLMARKAVAAEAAITSAAVDTFTAGGVAVSTQRMTEENVSTEAAVAALSGGGVDFRLRLTPAPVLQCTPLTAAQRAAVLAALHAQGFTGAALREEENISGFFDRQDAPVF